jgi:hypothetical protein
MTSSTVTSNLIDNLPASLDSATNWKRKSFESSTNNAFDLKRLAATVAIAFFVSPMTVLRDPWLQERRQRSAVITSSIYQDIIGRLISRSEALRIARKILEKAETERIEIFEWEAAHGIQWDAPE